MLYLSIVRCWIFGNQFGTSESSHERGVAGASLTSRGHQQYRQYERRGDWAENTTSSKSGQIIN